MELSKVIKGRKSIRHFNEQKLNKKEIEDILEHAILSPSAHNRQPWHYIVIENKTKKEEIADLLLSKTDASTTMTCEVIKKCQALILVFADITEEVMDIQSVGASIENMILRAYDLNIGSLWIGYIVKIEKELQEMFHNNKRLIAAVALGYTDTYPNQRPRKTLEEVTEWYE